MVFRQLYESITHSLRALINLFEPVIAYVREAFSILPPHFFRLSLAIFAILVVVKPSFVVLFVGTVICAAVATLIYKMMVDATATHIDEVELSPDKRAEMYLQGRSIT